MEFSHTSVLLNETIENLKIKPDGIYVDGTLGGAGHSSHICERLSATGRLIGIDQDEAAIAAAGKRLEPFQNQVTIIRSNYCDMVPRLAEIGVTGVDGILLDLGCGTGSMTELLAKQGYDMIGVDLSDSMLDIAMEKRAQSGHNILYLQQDMREFELYGTVRAVICLCDSLNYLLEEDDLLTTFKLVNNYLDPNGLFIFDFNTVYKYETVIGDSTIAENREDCSFIWENYYTAEDQINEYDLTIFVKQQKDLFRKFTETHLQRGYTLETMKRLLEQSGLIFVEALDADTHGSVTETSERIYVIAREHGKNLG